MPEFVKTGPLWLLIAFLFVAVSFRSQVVYWSGRLGGEGMSRITGKGRIGRTLSKFINGPMPRRGAAALDRWGIIIIPASFLTIGFQTAVNSGAGLVKMPWWKYTLAMIPGCFIWAVLYGLGLLALWTAFWTAVLGSWWGIAAMVAVGLVGIGLLWWRSKTRATAVS